MTTVAATPIIMKDAVVTIGTDSFEQAILEFSFEPASSIQTVKSISPLGVYTDNDAAAWTMKLNFLQDWDESGSLSNYLFAHAGEQASVTFEPKAGGASFAAEVTLASGRIGGSGGQWLDSPIEMGVQGVPVVTPA